MCTGNCLSSPTKQEDSHGLSLPSAMDVIGNSPDQKLLTPTYGRKRPGSVISSNSESDQSDETVSETGMQFGRWPSLADMMRSTNQFWFHIIVQSDVSLKTTFNHLLSLEQFLSFGEELVLESQGAPGTKLGWTLTVKTLEQNSGTAIAVRNMLSSTNFVEQSTYPIYLDGLTVTLSTWKLKGPQPFFLPSVYG